MNSGASPTPQLVPLPPSAVPKDFADELRGFGPISVLAILLIVTIGTVVVWNVAIPVSAVLVLGWVVLSRTPWPEIGYVRPKSWIFSAVFGLTAGILFKFAMKAVVMPLLGADAINHAYHSWVGNSAMLPFAIWASINAGFAEETVVRGFLFERLGKLFGESIAAKTFIVLVTALLFGIAHYGAQGISGAEQGVIVGLVFGAIFARTRCLFPLMFAHAGSTWQQLR